VYWFLMQVGIIAGFFTAWPVTAWLIRAGIKEAM
jgi:preprotein translocase subunit SecD